MEFFATCPKGFERLLANELSSLKIPRVRPLQGQVAFEGSLCDAYTACVWSRLASRIVAVLARSNARNSQELYDAAVSVAWEEHLATGSTFVVDASGTNTQLRSTQFVAMRVKDAIVDRLLSRQGTRSSVDANKPDVRVVTRLSSNRVSLGIDLTGDPLFKRGYVRKALDKGLRPDYAAALLYLGSWDKACEKPSSSVLAFGPRPDVMLIEACLMSAHCAPGILRSRWGFTKWVQHSDVVWNELLDKARKELRPEGLPRLEVQSPLRHTSQAKTILRSIGISADIALAGNKADSGLEHTLLVADLSEVRQHELVKEASWLGSLVECASTHQATRICLASRDSLPQAYLRKEPTNIVDGMLGRDPLQLQSFEGPIDNDAFTVSLPDGSRIPVLVSSSDQFAARLKKVAKARAKWAKREDVSCFRLYDSDLPDYAVTIDLFQGTSQETGELNGEKWLQIYEYAPPKGVDATIARARLMDVLALAPAILGVKESDTFLRIRRREKGGSQYANESRHAPAFSRVQKGGRVPLPTGAHLIDEGGLTFEVNFLERLDCGIFLDHRETRAMLREMAKQTQGSKRFLNLFAYTGTATCYAADGGMKHTTTVDLSRPSLDWARRNMARNGFAGAEHEFVQADVIAWIREQRHTKNRWDLVFCDVPTFSNSKGMGRHSFDVQRDHAELLINVSRLLTRNGTCVFSCNLRSFRPNEDALRKAGVVLEDITQRTIPEDFSRNRRIHHAYLMRRIAHS